MKSSSKIVAIVVASTLAASLPVLFAQDAAPPPPPPPPAPAPTPAAGSGMGRGQGAQGFGAQGFGAPQDTPSATEMAVLNKAIKDVLAKDADAKKVLDAHPNWAGPFISYGGGLGRNGAPGNGSGRGSGGRRGGGSGGGANAGGGSGG